MSNMFDVLRKVIIEYNPTANISDFEVKGTKYLRLDKWNFDSELIPKLHAICKVNLHYDNDKEGNTNLVIRPLNMENLDLSLFEKAYNDVSKSIHFWNTLSNKGIEEHIRLYENGMKMCETANEKGALYSELKVTHDFLISYLEVRKEIDKERENNA